MKKRKIILDESEIPENWYNIVADMPNKPLPPLNPSQTGNRWPKNANKPATCAAAGP